jgi:hypothetical protein
MLILSILTILLLGGQIPAPLQRDNLQQELGALTQRGFTYHLLDNDLIELIDPASGEKHLKSLHEPSEATIRAWANTRGVPILEIDPTQIDTNKFAGWYTYWAEVPLSNRLGDPLIVGDFDQNGSAEVYGVYYDSSTDQARIYQVDSAGTVKLLFNYLASYGISRREADADHDSLREICFTKIGQVSDFEQSSRDSLPTRLNFTHNRYQGDLDPGHTGMFIGNLDGDSLTDFLYKGSEPDSSNPTIGIGKEYVAEFNPDSNNFVRVWSTQFVPGQQSTTAGFAVEDFDRDGKMDFAVTEGLRSRVFFAENTGDNSYATVWQDSTPFVNLYFQTSGDVDGDGWPEFFVAATMSNGTWVLVYEADSNNSYYLGFLFHLLAGGVLDYPTLLTSDIDGNGKKELVILSGVYLFVFKSNSNDDYWLWYMKRERAKDAVQVYDFNHDGKQDFIISKLVLDSLNRSRFKADVYVASGIVSVPPDHVPPASLQLKANYPNPFNGTTIVSYTLPNTQKVALKVYDILGREVAVLVNVSQSAGEHQAIWNATGSSSGIYFCHLETQSAILTIKLLLMK